MIPSLKLALMRQSLTARRAAKLRERAGQEVAGSDDFFTPSKPFRAGVESAGDAG
jgi:hypothetical protein